MIARHAMLNDWCHRQCPIRIGRLSCIVLCRSHLWYTQIIVLLMHHLMMSVYRSRQVIVILIDLLNIETLLLMHLLRLMLILSLLMLLQMHLLLHWHLLDLLTWEKGNIFDFDTFIFPFTFVTYVCQKKLLRFWKVKECKKWNFDWEKKKKNENRKISDEFRLFLRIKSDANLLLGWPFAVAPYDLVWQFVVLVVWRRRVAVANWASKCFALWALSTDCLWPELAAQPYAVAAEITNELLDNRWFWSKMKCQDNKTIKLI